MFNRVWETTTDVPQGTMLRASEFVLYKRPRKRGGGNLLTPKDVRAIRSLKRPDKNRAAWYREVAERFNCSPKTVIHVYLGYTHR